MKKLIIGAVLAAMLSTPTHAQDIPGALKKLDDITAAVAAAKALLQPSLPTAPPVVAIPTLNPMPTIANAPANAILVLDSNSSYAAIDLTGPANGKVIIGGSCPEGRFLPGAQAVARVNHLTATSASGWTVRCVDLNGDPSLLYEVVSLDPSASHITLDRVFVHSSGQRRGIALNCIDGTVTNSYISGFLDTPVGGDTQGIGIWLGTGPYTITNNYIEAGSENIFVDASVGMGVGNVPSDILIKGNTLNKPAVWHDGRNHNVKNLLEFKAGRRVRVEDNDLSGNWADGQSGFAVVLTVRNDDGQTPWATIEHFVYINNRVSRAPAGINFLGHDDGGRQSGQANDIQILNSTFALDTTIAAAPSAVSAARTVQMFGAPQNVAFDHVTVAVNGWLSTIFTFGAGTAPDAPIVGLSVTNCEFVQGAYGIIGNAMGTGLATLNIVAPSIIWTNVIVHNGGNGADGFVSFPAGTTIVP